MVNIEGIKKYKSYKIYILSETNSKPKRIKIIDELIKTKEIIPFDYLKGDYVRKAISFLFDKRIVIKGIVHKGDEVYLLSDDFSKSL